MTTLSLAFLPQLGQAGWPAAWEVDWQSEQRCLKGQFFLHLWVLFTMEKQSVVPRMSGPLDWGKATFNRFPEPWVELLRGGVVQE